MLIVLLVTYEIIKLSNVAVVQTYIKMACVVEQ